MTRKATWLTLGFDAWALGLEAAFVVGARAAKLMAGGPAAQAETRRIVSEKMAVGLAVQTKALTGGLGTTAPSAASKTLRHYRAKVRANRRRLARS
jgi:hypothetical protein